MLAFFVLRIMRPYGGAVHCEQQVSDRISTR